MFDAVKNIRRVVDKTHPRGHLPYKVGDIHRAVTEVTSVDRILFNGYYDPDCDNPIWGRFRRFEGAELGPYAGRGCVIEIDYNKALESKPHLLRFVVVKEMCHALEGDQSLRVSGAADMERLIKALQSQHPAEAGAVFRPFLSEKMAEVCALELLCPLRDRKRIIAKRGSAEEMSDMAIAKAFWIPVEYVGFLFDPQFAVFMEECFGDGKV